MRKLRHINSMSTHHIQTRERELLTLEPGQRWRERERERCRDREIKTEIEPAETLVWMGENTGDAEITTGGVRNL